MNETFTQLKQQWKTAIEAGITTLTTKAPEAAKALKAMIDEYGGVSPFIEEMKKRGIPEKAKTWIEDGKKFVLSQDQVQKIMGDERIKKAAEKLKTTPDRLATLLGEALPPLLEKLEVAREKLDAASKSVPENSFVGGLLKKFGTLLGGTAKSEEPSSKSGPNPKV
jgi:uncharacterized protein YidB (DUF937 family)